MPTRTDDPAAIWRDEIDDMPEAPVSGTVSRAEVDAMLARMRDNSERTRRDSAHAAGPWVPPILTNTDSPMPPPSVPDDTPSSKTYSRIEKYGLELEGAWLNAPNSLKHDGSVRDLPGDMAVGELASRPISSFEAAKIWLRENYPTRSNHTCGFHVHLSFSELSYSRLMDEAFNDLFLERMEAFYVERRDNPGFDLFRSRLDGQNIYCRKIFRPEEQLWRTEPYDRDHQLPRYSILNFCYGRHQTLECRLFPMFPEVADSVAAFECFVKACHDYLVRCPGEKKFSTVIRGRGPATLPTLPPCV